MFYFEDEVLYLTRGDYAALTLTLTDDAGSPYTMQDGDTVTLTVRELPSRESAVILQVRSIEPRLVIAPEDTAQMAVGAYSADIQFMTADGKPITFWPRLEGNARMREKNYKNFIVMPEVTM